MAERVKQVRHPEVPDGYVELEVYRPHSSPWDCYKRKQANEWSKVLKDLRHVCEFVDETNMFPTGSGPGGRVRFGDDMMPGRVILWVHPNDFGEAVLALLEHKQAIRNWLHQGGPMPDACRS